MSRNFRLTPLRDEKNRSSNFWSSKTKATPTILYSSKSLFFRQGSPVVNLIFQNDERKNRSSNFTSSKTSANRLFSILKHRWKINFFSLQNQLHFVHEWSNQRALGRAISSTRRIVVVFFPHNDRGRKPVEQFYKLRRGRCSLSESLTIISSKNGLSSALRGAPLLRTIRIPSLWSRLLLPLPLPSTGGRQKTCPARGLSSLELLFGYIYREPAANTARCQAWYVGDLSPVDVRAAMYKRSV